MSELERQLYALGDNPLNEDVPDVASSVRQHLQPASSRRRTRLVVVASALFLVSAVGVLAASNVSDDILQWLGLHRVKVTRVEQLPPVASNGPLRLGERVTVAQAARLARFRILTPKLLGRPDAVYFVPSASGGVVTVVYRSESDWPQSGEQRLGLVLTEQRAGISSPLIQKLIAMGVRVEWAQVSKERAVWLEGPPHIVIFEDRRGGVLARSRLAANTLLWQRNGLLLRLETSLSREQAVAIAESLEPSR